MSKHPSLGPRKHSTVRRPFGTDEDARLIQLVKVCNGWEAVASQMWGRTARQCRERWANYLKPSVQNGPWTETEDHLLLFKINELGRCWSVISNFFPQRSENDIKNRWHSHLKHVTEVFGTQFVLKKDACGQTLKKKRNRTKICPKENALRRLEELSALIPAVRPQMPEPLPDCNESLLDLFNDSGFWDMDITLFGLEDWLV
jgi:hypothetical protein